MKNKSLWLSLIMVMLFLLGACSPTVISLSDTREASMEEEGMSGEDEMVEDRISSDEMEMENVKPAEGDELMEDDEMMDDEATSDEEDSMPEDSMDAEVMDIPQWFRIPLTNIHTGETFTIEDLQGKVVLFETMAIWCSNCFRQQGEVAKLHDLIGERNDLISLGVDIDPNENAHALVDYTNKNGFDWWYIVAPTELSRELAANYGDQFLNPPSTPMLIVDRHGDVHPLPFGIKSAESLMDALEPFLDESS